MSVRPMTTTPPGWYPANSHPGFERWWDGRQWLPITRPAPESRTIPADPGEPVTRARKWHWPHILGRRADEPVVYVPE